MGVRKPCAYPWPVPSLDPSFLCDFTCTEVSGMSIEHAQELAMAIKQKNITLRVDQVSP